MVMSEQGPTPEKVEQLRNLIELSERLLKDAPVRPGKAYKPIERKHGIIGILLNRPYPDIVGYEEADEYTREHDLPFGFAWGGRPYKHQKDLTETEERLFELVSTGVYRSKYEPTNLLGGWFGHIQLMEFQQAKLEGKDVVPTGTEKIYRFGVFQSSSDGRGADSFMEEMVFSSEAGLLEHRPSEWLKPNENFPEPLDRVAEYLRLVTRETPAA